MEQNVYRATPIERWAYFLRNADQLSQVDVRRLFPDQEFVEAAGVLEMISRTPEQQMQYDARLKFQRNVAARIEYARDEGIREGIEKGRVIGALLGRITLLMELLGRAEPTPDELAKYTEDQLSEFAEQLQNQLRSRS